MSQIKRVLVTGGNGYVGNYFIKTMALRYPDIEVVGMSRRGTPRSDDPVTKQLQNVSFIKGDCLKPESFKDSIQDVDAIIHTVGILFESKKDPQRTYAAVNRDAAINMAKVLNKSAEEQAVKKNFVMVGSEKAPPFLSAYLDTKLEAENYIINQCAHLHPTMLRPGFIVDKAHRSWSPIVGFLNDTNFAAY